MKTTPLWLALGFAVGMVAWSTGCQSAPAKGMERGEHLFSNYCAPCHTATGIGKSEVAAPAIAGLPQWYVQRQLMNYRGDLRGYHYDDIEGMRMKPMAMALMADSDVAIVAEYVAGLTPSQPAATLDGDATKGKALYGTCAACHQAGGTGNEAMAAPPLINTHDWYLVTQLGKFKHGVRGKKDQYGASMAPMASGLADEQAMRDVVAYILTLRQ